MYKDITTDLRFIVGPFWGIINRHRPDLRITINEKENADKYLQLAKEKCEEKGIAFEQIMAKGQPREVLLEHEKEFDLIVIGRADWGSKLLGSVSNGIVSNSKKDVLLVK